jgi:cyclophilin family peptidyl-prolyl cis-trans isomerase/HEAT repeat protein
MSRAKATLAALAFILAPYSAEAQRPAPAAAEVRASARLLAMADERYLDTTFVDSVIARGPSWLRVQAVRAIGQVKGRERAAAVRTLIANTDTAVAATAAFAAGLLRDTAAVPALTSALDGPPTVRDEAAAALGRIGEPARAALLASLRARPSAAVLVALYTFRPVPVAEITPFLRSDAADVRWAATYALTRNPNREAAAPLLAVVDLPPAVGAGTVPRSDASDIRANIARALARTGVPDTLQPMARVALGRLLSDPHPHVRISALRSLASYVTVSRGLIEATIATDPDANVRLAAIQAAGPVFGPDSAAWESLFAADTSTMSRIAIMQAANQQGFKLAALDSTRPDTWMRDADPRKRAVAASLMIPMGDTASIDLGMRLRQDPSPIVVRAALSALARSARPEAAARDSGVIIWFGTAAGGLDDVWARGTAISGFGRIATGAMVGALVRAYERALGDPLPAARHAVLQSLAAIWRRDSTGFGAWADTLTRWPAPADARALDLARNVPPLAAWAGAPRPRRTNAEWIAIVQTIVVPSLQGKPLRATFVTSRGTIEVDLDGAEAPLTVANLRALATSGAYDNILWHRVVPYFVAQGGDPSGTGSGSPGYTIRDELNRTLYLRGTIGMAHAGPETGSSQWFFGHSPQPHLDALHTTFGRVTAGLDVMDALVQQDYLISVRVR